MPTVEPHSHPVPSHGHDATYVNVSGDTMTGPLVVPSLAIKLTNGNGSILRPGGANDYPSFRNAADTAAVPVLVGEPNTPAAAATKGYVDGKVSAGQGTATKVSDGHYSFPNPRRPAAPLAALVSWRSGTWIYGDAQFPYTFIPGPIGSEAIEFWAYKRDGSPVDAATVAVAYAVFY